jgi:alpha-ketoglutarate-dependent taurine dioxygenase
MRVYACYRGSDRIQEEAKVPYQTIEVRKLTPHIGAEIGGVDLSRPLGKQQFQEVHDALMENLVVFFRGQTLTHDQHKAFGRLFGELAIHPASPHAPEGRAAAGQHPLPDGGPAGGRRHAVRQHVCRLRQAVAADQAAGRGADRDP